MYDDLISRTCGFLGVLIALIVAGIYNNPQFIVTPEQSFYPLELVLNAGDSDSNSLTFNPPPAAAPLGNTLDESVLESQNNEIDDTDTEELIDTNEQAVESQTADTSPEITNDEVKQQMIAQKSIDKNEKDKKEVKEVKEVDTKSEVKPLAKDDLKKETPKEHKLVKKHEKSVFKTNDQSKTTKHAVESNLKYGVPNGVQGGVKGGTPDGVVGGVVGGTGDISDAAARARINAQLSSLLVSEIKSRISYPRNAVRRKLEGTVLVEFSVQNGVVISFKIERTSGHKILDEAARKLAQSIVKFNTKLATTNNVVIIPIKYELI